MTRIDAVRLARLLRGLAVVAALGVAGCGGGPAAVSGVVTLDGQPLDGAVVTFTPTAADEVGGSSGKTDAQGRYTLRTVLGDKAGASVGKHKVAVSLYKENPKNPDQAGSERVPQRYNQKTELTFDVPAGGTDKANFDLKTK
jgi:hypothetical protein